MRDQCLDSTTEYDGDYQDIEIQEFKIKKNLTKTMKTSCDKMTWNEVKYLGYFRYKQKKLLTTKTSSRTLWDEIATFVPFI